jgi:hypothetical protein
MSKIHFITYANSTYENSRKRIIQEALNFGAFDHIEGFTPETLSPTFKNKHRQVLNEKRGGGYWIWKYHIIYETLSKLNDNDFLVYADAGCSFNIHGKKRFFEYLKLLDESEYGVLSFQLTPHLERCWTAKKVLKHFNVSQNNDILDSGQYMATVIFLQKNKHSMEFAKTLSDLPSDLFIDVKNKDNEDKSFKDHRHDQSIGSVYRKLFGSVVLNDETYELINGRRVPFGKGKNRHWPIWATRKK